MNSTKQAEAPAIKLAPVARASSGASRLRNPVRAEFLRHLDAELAQVEKDKASGMSRDDCLRGIMARLSGRLEMAEPEASAKVWKLLEVATA